MPKLPDLVREEGNRYSNSRNVPVLETLDSEFNQLVSYCNQLNNYAAEVEQGKTPIKPGDDKKVLVSNRGVKWEKLTDDYVESISGDKIIDSTLALSKLSGISPNGVLVSDADSNVKCSLITQEYLNNSVITAVKLAANSVITEKINNAAVTTEKINNAAVTTEKISDSAVTYEKIAAAAINSIAENIAHKIEQILNLPKFELIKVNPNTHYLLDQSYKNHIVILPIIDANTGYIVNWYRNGSSFASYVFNTHSGSSTQGRGGIFILYETDQDKIEFDHNLPFTSQDFVDIKLNKVYE